MMSRKTIYNYSEARVCFPDDELKFKWLPLLLDAYAIIDSGIEIAINEEENKRNVKAACKNGCDICCITNKDIPVYPLELVGIYWYAVEKITQPMRSILRKQLSAHTNGATCPFLVNSSCSIYSLRPIACRQFTVFNKPCSEEEDPYFTRRNDVLTPIQDYTDQAFLVMLPFYGITEEADKQLAIKNNLIHTQVRILQLLTWKELAARMDKFDLKQP